MKKVLIGMLLAAVTAFGAGWDSVTRITEGQKIELRMRDGAELKGTFISATAESIAIRYKSGEQSVDRVNVLRVRVHDAVARIEVGTDEIPRLFEPEISGAIHERFRENGFLYVSVDLKGYRTGSMNEGLSDPARGLVDGPHEDM